MSKYTAEGIDELLKKHNFFNTMEFAEFELGIGEDTTRKHVHKRHK